MAYLPYEAVEPEVAVPFLRLVALSEGHILPESNITSLYNLESPAPPTPSHFFKAHGDAYPSYQPLPCPDLRKALSQLQFECQWALGVSAVSWMDFNRIGREERTAWSRWKEVVTPAPSSDFCTVQVDSLVAAEALSFMDAHISRGTIDLIEVSSGLMPLNTTLTTVSQLCRNSNLQPSPKGTKKTLYTLQFRLHCLLLEFSSRTSKVPTTSSLIFSHGMVGDKQVISTPGERIWP